VTKHRSLSFRTRLVLAMAGAVAVVLVIALAVVDAQTESVTREFIDSTSRQTDANFQRVEVTSRRQLTALGERFAQSNRIAALLQVAQYEGLDVEHFSQEISYELQIVNAPRTLVAVTDLNGDPITAHLENRPLPDAASALPKELLAETIERADTISFGYHLLGDHLYAVHLRLQRLVDEPLGLALFGTPIDNAVVEQLRPSGNGQICLSSNGRCYASTITASSGITQDDMIRHADARDPVEINGHLWAFISKPLPGGGPYARVIAIPLDDVLAPFTRIQTALRIAGPLAMLLGVALALFLARGLTRPIRALMHATERVARGDYDAEIEDPSSDEIGKLTASFNQMTAGLRLKEKYRGVLDKVVSPEIAAEMVRGEIALGGEIREVSTLFADIRGFTPMTEGMDPVLVISILNQVMERASDAVEAEGGVVDKYVGDEIMALFGAPKSAPDDAQRAVRAALRIRDAIAEFTREREARGERGVGVGIGINTGPAVAGNMGSPRRLNYTVLGESVNIAARLCSLAQPQQIVIAQSTYDMVRDVVTAEHIGDQQLKGISRPLPVYAVHALRSPASTPASTPPAGAGRTAAVAGLLALLAAAPAHAQRWLQIDLSGRAEIAAYVPGDDPSWLIDTTRPFLAPRASIFGDFFLGERVYSFIELRADRGDTPGDRPLQVRVEQAFVRFSPQRLDMHAQVGRFVTPFGEYPQRHHTTSDPFIRPPLPYQHRTTLAPDDVPAAVDGFLNWKDDPEGFRSRGAPMVWNIPYQLGAMVFGGVGPVTYRAAVLSSAPSSHPREWNNLDRFAFVGHGALHLGPALEVGLSYDRGPYLSTLLPASLDTFPIRAGSSRSRDDYMQQIWGLNAVFARDRFQARAEAFLDRWEVPNVQQTVREIAWTVEARLRFQAGFDVAARAGAIYYNDVTGSAGAEPWDFDTRRLQFAAGYRFTQSIDARVEYMLNDSSDPRPLDDNLLSLRFAWNLDRLWR